MSNEEKQEMIDLVEQFITLESLIHRHFEKRRREQGPFGNPHKGQGRVLSLLKLQPTITQKELSFLLDMRPQSLGELLSKLEASHYITREPSAEDRRVMMIQLTEAGKQAAEQIDQAQITDSIFDRLTEEEQVDFSTIMTKLITELEKEIPEGDRRGFGGFRGGHRPDFRGGRPTPPPPAPPHGYPDHPQDGFRHRGPFDNSDHTN